MTLHAEQVKFIIVENENHTIQAQSLLESPLRNKIIRILLRIKKATLFFYLAEKLLNDKDEALTAWRAEIPS